MPVINRNPPGSLKLPHRRGETCTSKLSTPVKIFLVIILFLGLGVVIAVVVRSCDCSSMFHAAKINVPQVKLNKSNDFQIMSPTNKPSDFQIMPPTNKSNDLNVILPPNKSNDLHVILPPNKSNTVLIPDTWKAPSLLNISDFRWIRNNASVCTKNLTNDAEEKLLLIMVSSARENYNERSAIRKAVKKMETTINKNSEWKVGLVFLLGGAFQPEDSADNSALFTEEIFLNEEYSVFGDLITGDFIEASENLTYKTMMGLKWALTFCSNASFIVKMNDDVFFNIPMFVQLQDMEKRGSIPEVPSLYCIPEVGKMPVHKLDKDSFEQKKWLVSESEWPENTFPDYCQGLLYGMTMDLAQKMYSVSSSVKYFRIEEIFLTGVVMDKVKETYGLVHQRDIKTSLEYEHTIRTVCEKRMLRQTVALEIGLVVKLERGGNMEKYMLCLAKDV